MMKERNVAAQILATDDVAKIKALGRLVKNYDDYHWIGQNLLG
jgi:hypothetical protein